MFRFALLLFLARAVAADAQILQPPQPRQPSWTDQWTFGAAFMGGLPLGEFRNEENGGFGGEISIGYQLIRRQPIILRFSGGTMKYHAVKARGYQEACDQTGCWLEEVEYDLRSHSMLYTHVGPELTAINGRVRPFAFAMLGRTFWSSRLNVKPTSPGGQEFSQSLFSSNNFSTAYGAGVRSLVSSSGRDIGVEISARVDRNADARYLTERGVTENPDGSYTISPRRGPANLLGIYLGLWIGPNVLWNER